MIHRKGNNRKNFWQEEANDEDNEKIRRKNFKYSMYVTCFNVSFQF